MKTVCIIGLGPAGLVALKELKAKKFEVTGYDSQSSIGGVWSSPGASHGVYKELTLNTPRAFMEFSDFPWNKEDFNDTPPDEGGVYANASEFRAYLLAYAKKFDLEPSISLNTRVISIQHKEGGGYTVTTMMQGSNKEDKHDFDAVIMCSGRHEVPADPLKDTTFRDFSGKLVHSQDVKSLTAFDEKRVLVVGASVSGSDLTAALARRGKCSNLVNSVRKAPYHLDKFSQDGTAADAFMFVRLIMWIKGYMPESIAFEGLKSNLVKNCPEQLTEEITKNPQLVPNKDIRKASVGYSSGYVEAAKERLFTIKPGIESVSGNTVTFHDGEPETFDVVICCTGYRGWDLSILPKDIQDAVTHVGPSGFVEPALYKRTFVPNFPDIAFIGVPNIGAASPLSELQARYIAAVFHGDIPRPTESKIAADAKAFANHRDKGLYNRYDIVPEIQEQIGVELGVTPTWFQAMKSPSTLLFGPMYPCYYRMTPAVDGEEVAARAKERFEWCLENPPIRQDS